MRGRLLNRSESAVLAVILLAAVLLCIKPGQWHQEPFHPPDRPAEPAPLQALPDSSQAVKVENPRLPYGYPNPEEASRFASSIADTLRRNDSMYASLSRHGLGPQRIRTLLSAFGKVFNLKQSHPGDYYWCGLDTSGAVGSFSYWSVTHLNNDEPVYFNVSRHDSVLAGREVPIPTTVSIHGISGEIRSSLYNSIISLGEKPPLDGEIADVFQWDIDFNVDSRAGDKFKIVYEKVFIADEFRSYGRILAAEYAGERDTFRAVYYTSPDERTGYYNLRGRSLRRTFLKSPLRYNRISSRFSSRRLHPIYRIYRPHYGVDYAAPTGTKVHVTADGKVVGIGYKGDNGRYIKIKHASEISTYYLHLSRYARGMKLGATVRQGDLIGYVGTTGASTGPHLDYRLSRRGRFVDPRTQKFPSADPIKAEDIGGFQVVALRMTRALNDLNGSGLLSFDMADFAD